MISEEFPPVGETAATINIPSTRRIIAQCCNNTYWTITKTVSSTWVNTKHCHYERATNRTHDCRGCRINYISFSHSSTYWQYEVKADLDRDVRLGVMEPVPVGESVTWCHRMVVVQRTHTHIPTHIISCLPAQ